MSAGRCKGVTKLDILPYEIVTFPHSSCELLSYPWRLNFFFCCLSLKVKCKVNVLISRFFCCRVQKDKESQSRYFELFWLRTELGTVMEKIDTNYKWRTWKTFRLNFSRFANRDVAPLTLTFESFNYSRVTSLFMDSLQMVKSQNTQSFP